MRRYCWTVVNTDTKEKIGYESNHMAVTEEHVRNSPSVKEWAKGSPVEILPEAYCLVD